MPKPTGYSRLQIGLHWIIAVLIIACWFTGDTMGRALRARIQSGEFGIDLSQPHAVLGGAVFALILIRVVVRLLHGVPDHPPGTSALMGMAATWGHRLLYALMIAVPACGAAAWYGGVRAAGDLHESIANALLLVAFGHALVAIWHHVAKKDGTLTRMLRAR